MNIWLVSGAGLLALLLVLYVSLKLYWVIGRRPGTYPSAAFIQKLQRKPTVHRLACLGDSITQGDLGESYVRLVEQHFSAQPLAVINAGINGDLSYTLWRRLNDVIATQPTLITLLIGTNDVQASLSKQNTAICRQQGKIQIHETPSFEGYQATLANILHRLKNETSARIAILSLPLISEDLEYQGNQVADQYSDFLRELARQTNVDYLPLREQQKEFLRRQTRPAQSAYADTNRLMTECVFWYLRGMRWDQMAARHSNLLSIDNLHSTTCAARMMADLVVAFVEQQLAPGLSNFPGQAED